MRLKQSRILYVVAAILALALLAGPSFGADSAAETQQREADAPVLYADSAYAIPDQYIVVFKQGATAAVTWIEEHREELLDGTAPLVLTNMNVPTCAPGTRPRARPPRTRCACPAMARPARCRRPVSGRSGL